MDTQTIVNLVLNIGLPLFIGVGGSYFLIFKRKLSQVRKLVDDFDNAMIDNSVGEQEAQDIWADLKVLVGK